MHFQRGPATDCRPPCALCERAEDGAPSDVPPTPPPAAGAGEAAAPVEWSEEQEVMLVRAVKKVAKDATERWEKISALVPGRTKAQCMRRFKELKEGFKARKKGA